ncbi:MAG TPA: VOC family protein [Candidatus Udaeobacter sp.]|jgi:catechol 2,3-dioxygenase-like lactoylglutathione lyase family enzyme|nr:VOC family protein [Candidatus Udaeobacter sp.]
MKIKDIGSVGIPVTDIPRAGKFYAELLGLPVSEEMMCGKWIEFNVGDNTLAIANVGEDWKPSHDPEGNKLIVHKLKPENEKGVCK